jgi:hydroxymethylglutaryl-CoA lyase
MNRPEILISEVGPRDGLQSITPIMPTNAKKAWIAAEAAAGVREIEVGSFVPARILPQLADTAELVAFARTIPDLTVAVLVPNLRGAEAAVAAGAHKITLPLSVSETHSLRNVNRTHAQMLYEAQRTAELIKAQPADRRPHFEGGLSTAFGCTIEGLVPEAAVQRLAEALMAAGCDEVGLSDTTGYANPAQVKRLLRLTRAVVGDAACTGIHLHNTRGLGLANALAALEEGVTTLDSSLGGIGGCPFAPGASGNIVTEDLAFMLEAMGVATGVDLPALLKVRTIVQDALPGVELYGFTPEAGLPLGFEPATA